MNDKAEAGTELEQAAVEMAQMMDAIGPEGLKRAGLTGAARDVSRRLEDFSADKASAVGKAILVKKIQKLTKRIRAVVMADFPGAETRA